MNPTLEVLLNGTEANNILPFFWQHGEDEATLRKYMQVIQDSGCGAVCVESRPHPDFCGPGWWHDMDIILDEARARGMKVWILDDKHFPTGYAGGAFDDAPAELCRQSIYCAITDYEDSEAFIEVALSDLAAPPDYPKSRMQMAIEQRNPPNHRHFDDDRLLSIIAVQVGETADFNNLMDLLPFISNGILRWTKPAGKWRIYATGLSRNYGPHRNYMNMMDGNSCRVLINAVYEPHFAHYHEDFGNTISGFFSDEPELGNGQLYPLGNVLGTPQDLPWSRDLESELHRRMGEQWAQHMPLLWEDGAEPRITAQLRTQYMDAVSRLVERCFSMQLGDWCEQHGVMYIGHVVEDNNQDARTGSSLGHYFRGLAGQHMAGIDDIGGQVLPQGEDEPATALMGRARDGEFYHFMLGKLASSHAAIDSRKKGRAMCEIFGNYGWRAGVYLEKYLVDHFLVRGINYMVPHAFNPGPYPDRDCPPHFYANGHNPQYRHFGALMRYTNRLCQLLSGGTHVAPVAILYHAEAEWSGGAYMYAQKPARQLMEHQIDFDVIPADVFSDREQYRTSMEHGLTVNTQQYSALVIPMAQFLTAGMAKAVAALHQTGFPVIFVDALPEGISSGEDDLLIPLKELPVVPLTELPGYLRAMNIGEISISPSDGYIRCLHYKSAGDVYMIVNEGVEAYTGTVRIPSQGECFAYNAWDNRLEEICCEQKYTGSELSVFVEPRKSLVVVFSGKNSAKIHTPFVPAEGEILLSGWQRSTCKSIDYPIFSTSNPVELPDTLSQQRPDFSGYVRYATTFHLDEVKPLLLDIEDAAEGVEVFINGISAGIQIVPPFRYDVSALVCLGENQLVIEVATTLEREYIAGITNPMEKMMAGEATGLAGITGRVTLRF